MMCSSASLMCFYVRVKTHIVTNRNELDSALVIGSSKGGSFGLPLDKLNTISK